MSVDLALPAAEKMAIVPLPAAEKMTIVLEAVGDDKIRVNSSSLDYPPMILVD